MRDNHVLRSDAADGAPGELPADLRVALNSHSAVVTSSWRKSSRHYLTAAGPDFDLFGRWSAAKRDFDVYLHEVSVRTALRDPHHFRTPPVLQQGQGWLLERRIVWDSCKGDSGIDAALNSIEEINSLTIASGPSYSGKSNFMGRTARRWRAIANPDCSLGIIFQIKRAMLQARRALELDPLPPVNSHGDFHTGNFKVSEEGAWVIDWESSGPRPAGYDLMTLWCYLQDPRDRSRLFDGALDIVGRARHRGITRLRYYLAIRTALRKLLPDDAADLDVAGGMKLVHELPELAATTGAQPRKS